MLVKRVMGSVFDLFRPLLTAEKYDQIQNHQTSKDQQYNRFHDHTGGKWTRFKAAQGNLEVLKGYPLTDNEITYIKLELKRRFKS